MVELHIKLSIFCIFPIFLQFAKGFDDGHSHHTVGKFPFLMPNVHPYKVSFIDSNRKHIPF
jgi:hypothetical protein